MNIAQPLRKLMDERKLSNSKLAREVGVHVSTVTNWKDGANPKIEHLKLVADYFGVTVDYLLADQKEEP